MTETERIERLESIVRALYQQVAELRAEVGALRGGAPGASPARPAGVEQVEQRVEPTPASLAPPAPPTPEATATPAPPAPPAGPAGSAPYRPPPFVPRPKPSAIDLEALIGRYGTIALATLAILMGAGAFLTWAIAHGLLGPVQRVILGAIGAAALGGVGVWLRGRGTVRFGNIVLALALALVHLDAWAAGPRLHVVSPTLALGAAALASVALATLALGASEESLFSVGLGGALLAPFVTSTGGGTAPMLATYGWIVIAGGIAALRERRWRIALFILGAACAAYAAAARDLVSTMSPWLDQHAATLFALACAAAALLWGAHAVRARLALAFLVVAMLAQLPTDASTDRLRSAIPLALAGTLLAYAALRAGVPASEVLWRLAGAMVAPLGFLAGAVGALVRPETPTGAAIAAGWTVLALAMAWAEDELRGLHLAAAALASGAGVFLALSHAPNWCIIALAAHAALFAWVLRRASAPAVAGPVVLGLVVASLWAYDRLALRPAYGYDPFLTFPSAAALSAVLAWWLAWRELARAGADDARVASAELIAMVRAAAWLAAFFWVREELARAIARDVATFLLIIYYALTGVGAIFYGRRRALPRARAIGLALAFYGGIKALLQAWDISAIGLRVGSCLLVGLFIALVSYWYRAPDDGRAAAEAPLSAK